MNKPPDDHSDHSTSVAARVDLPGMAWFGSPGFRLQAVCLALFCGTVLLFSRSVGHGFLDCDDPDYVTQNAHVQAGLTWAGVRWAFTSGDAANWFPLTWLSHMLDWQLFGNDSRGHHATNIFWHALNAVMAFLALRRLTSLRGNGSPVSASSSPQPDAGNKTTAETASARQAGAFWTSAVCAALFAWHPLRAESVAWVAERKDVLSGFFFFLTLWAYASYAEKRRDNLRGAKRFYAFALAAFAAGLLCKPMLVTLPCLLLLLDWWPLKRFAIRRLVLEKIPFFLLTIVSCVVTYRVQKAGNAVVETFNFGARLANAAVSVAGYLGKFFWPFNLALGYRLPDHWPAGTVIGATALLLAVTGVALWQWRRRPWLLVGWFWFLGMLMPVLGIVQVGLQAMADRYTYLPMLGLQLALLWTLAEVALHPAARRFAPAAVALLLAVCAARTWNQLGTWQNSRTLYEHSIAVTSDNYLAYSYLATTFLNEGQYSEAESDFRRAIGIKPDYAAARYRLGVTLEKMGRPDEALATYQALLKIRPNYAAAHYSIGVILLSRNQPAEAMTHFQTALRKNPDHASAQMALGMALAQLGRPQEAIACYEKVLALNPSLAEADYNYANALVSLDRDAEALARYEKALQLNPDFAEAHGNYANLLRKLGRLEEACAHYRRAIDLQPEDANTYYGLGAALEELGRTNEALASYTRAVELKPDYADAQFNLGVMLLNRSQPAEATPHFQAATRSQPDYAAAYLGLGLAAAQLGNQPEAIDFFQRTLAIEPDNAEAHAELGRMLYRTGHPAEAIPHLEQALKLHPGFPGVAETLAKARDKQGRPSDDAR